MLTLLLCKFSFVWIMNNELDSRLRLAKLNEEMKNDELGNPTEELLNDMVRDLSSNKLSH